LQSLAEGGMQVGELACMMHPGGRAIETLNSEDATIQTNDALQDKNVILYEPVITYDDKFLIRVDVFEIYGNDVNLIEVKAKSWSYEDEIFNRNGTFKSTWRPNQINTCQSLFHESCLSYLIHPGSSRL
jgi:hypothetical protein